MDSLRQFGTGILLAVISVVLILGGFSLAMVEGKVASSTVPTPTFVLAIAPGLPTLPAQPLSDTVTPASQETATSTQIPDLPVSSSTLNPFGTPTALVSFGFTPTVLVYFPTVANCTAHAGYVAIIVKLYDTISSLALTYNMTQAAILQANCLTSEQLQVGSVLYVLPRAAPTYSVAPTQCGAQYGWISYYVVSGDTLYNISLRYRVTVAQLQLANCLGTSDYILVGQALKVPNVATTAPQVTSTSVPISTAVLTATTHPSNTPAASQTPVSPTPIPPTATSAAPPPTVVPVATTAVPPPTVAPTATTAVPSFTSTPSADAGPSSSATPLP